MMAMSHPGQLGWLISVYLEQVYYSTHSFVVDKHQGKKACAPAQWPQTARLQDTAAFNLPQGSDSSDVLAVTQCWSLLHDSHNHTALTAVVIV
ncbi:uncharacterized protein BO96DRAFT_436755 [Aspergillus niger CBS 101883]|uniref:Contig An14c0100, genomic contig n=2 Tax=Aspergillus niger TaxID=5061 RepID=A2R2V7_ASPNC|nr:uncharacterized protein BO96DRAFT_436755 [Aspergillus niger CBS 101883]XP_059602277.1 uncharacterized protein An14g02110 [Aspergillus niger]PYH53848.1 hypothetical protein BO96DRAFT_436755 [Aspergillus niger CBS 101883]CAK41948.1 unnamed protein product [Aspergillus niger]